MRKLLLLLCLGLGSLPAATLYTFNWDTSALDPGSDYILEFLLIGSVGNQATLSNFQYGGGNGREVPLVLDTFSNFFNDGAFAFQPGASMSFSILLTDVLPANPADAPDQLSIYVLGGSFETYSTTDLFASSIATIDLGTNQRATYAGTSPVEFAAPQLIPPTNPTNPANPVIPEPGTLGLTLGALTWWCLRRRKV